MKQLRILVVDDEPANLDLGRAILAELGHEVTTRQNGRQALEILLERDYSCDVVLMDLRMPGIDGVEATRRLRLHPRTRDLPILCVATDLQGAEAQAGIEAGANACLTKPYQRDELLRVMARVLLEHGVIGAAESIGQA